MTTRTATDGASATEGGGEGGNRTHPPARSAGATILKTVTTTRHVSLSTFDPTVHRETPGLEDAYARRSGFDLADDRGAMKAVGPETVEHLVHRLRSARDQQASARLWVG